MTVPFGGVSNGLPADDWARLDSVPFPVMQHLMVELRGAGIPAYAVADIDDSPLRALNRRSPLNQRVYVDRQHLDLARRLLQREVAAHESALLDSAVDTEFAQLVATLGVHDQPAELGAQWQEEHFEPPVPEIEITADPIARAAWVGLLGGPALLVLSLFGAITLGGLAPLLAVAAFVAGFITLVVRMPERLPVEDGPDDGAVV